MPSAEQSSLRAIQRADLPVVAELLREPWPEVDWERRFERQWFDNPAWDDELALGWAHETDEGLESFFGSLPLAYWIGGRPERAFAATALYVRPALRGRGLAEALVRAWLEQGGGGLWINSTSNEASAPLFDRLELGEKRRAAAEAEAFLVARPFHHARRRAAHHRGGKVLRWPLALAGGLSLWWRQPRPRPPDPPWSWQRLAEAGPELDELWARERPPERATLRRDASTLHWLYFAGPSARDNFLLVGRDGAGRARALAGFHREREPSLLRQLDLFGALEGPGAWASLVAAATRLAAEAGIDVVRFRADAGAQARRLDELGLEPRPCVGTIYYRLLEYAEPEHEPLFTDLDGDRCVELLL